MKIYVENVLTSKENVSESPLASQLTIGRFLNVLKTFQVGSLDVSWTFFVEGFGRP